MIIDIKIYMQQYIIYNQFNYNMETQQNPPLCAYNKQVYQVCINPGCKQVCFICDNKCQCKLLHKKCDKVDWDYIYDNLDKNIIKNTWEFKSFSDTLDQLYQTIIKDVQKAYDDFKKWRDDFGLTKNQALFLKILEEGRFTELTSKKMYEIRKEIRTQSKIILKSENQLKEEVELINNYIEKLIQQQLKGLYVQNKVIKEELKQQKQQQNNDHVIKMGHQIQTKVNLAHKLLGLNENGSKFFTMINEGVIEKQLVIILEKVNQTEKSISDNKKGINETINNIKQKIEKLTGKVDQVKIETKLNTIKYKLITSINVSFDFLKSSSLYILFQDSIIALSQPLKKQCIKKYLSIQEKLTVMMQDYSANKLSFQNLNQQFSKLEEQAVRYRKQMDLKINLELANIKTKAISIYFTNKKIKTLTLLYKASENNFQVSKFWDKCNGRTNTVTILKTQFGKIIGGYTPLAWNKSINTYQQDISRQTFLFSITQKHKIPIAQNQGQALYHGSTYGPVFGNGGRDLLICDRANVSESSQGNIGNTYNNGDYTYDNQQSRKKWSGQSNGHKFLIQQWEVYQITFD